MNVTETNVIREVPVIVNTTTITIKTLKEKYLAQLPWIEKDFPFDLEVIGLYHGSITIVRQTTTGHLFRVSWAKWQDHLIGPRQMPSAQFVELRDKASASMTRYPQIFED